MADLLDAANLLNAASAKLKAAGMAPHISVNGPDYGDRVNVSFSVYNILREDEQ